MPSFIRWNISWAYNKYINNVYTIGNVINSMNTMHNVLSSTKEGETEWYLGELQLTLADRPHVYFSFLTRL